MDAIKVLLYSGGMDSHMMARLWEPDVKLYVDMGTKYSEAEMQQLPKDVLVVSMRDLGQFERGDAIIPMRNLILVALASNYGNVIALGATAGDRPRDKSNGFAILSSTILEYLWAPQSWTEGKEVEVVLPYKDCSKTALLRHYVETGGSLEEAAHTFSCYTPIRYARPFRTLGGEPPWLPCWACKACVRKFASLYEAGYRGYPKEVERSVVLHMSEGMLEDARKMTRGDEDTAILNTWEALSAKYL